MYQQITMIKDAPVLFESEPKIKLSEDVMLTDEFRAKTNKWLEDRFGHKCPFVAVKAITVDPGKILASLVDSINLLRYRRYSEVTHILIGPKDFHDITGEFIKDNVSMYGSIDIMANGFREVLGCKICVVPHMDGILPIYSDTLQ